MTNAISYGGYYSTGGSIVRDIFREFEPSIGFSTEFRLLKDPGGLFDLEDALFKGFAPENIDKAIRDFIWLTHNLARKSGRLRKSGMDYDIRTNNAFSIATKNFIDEISDYHYPMSWHYLDFQKSYISQISQRVIKKLFSRDVRKLEGDSLATLAYPGQEKYFTAAKKYIMSILSGIQQANGISDESVVGLHNAIPPFSVELIEKGIKYFPSCKVIITDRDPRDVFVNYPKDSYGRYLPRSDDLISKAEGFVHFYKSIRVNQKAVALHHNVLFLRFEDVCLNYAEYYDKILDFAGLDKSKHKNKGELFNPEKSINNIGMWRDASGELAQAVSFIEDKLPEYLYTS